MSSLRVQILILVVAFPFAIGVIFAMFGAKNDNPSSRPSLLSLPLPIQLQTNTRSIAPYIVIGLLVGLVFTVGSTILLFLVSKPWGPVWAHLRYVKAGAWGTFLTLVLVFIARTVIRDYRNPETLIVAKDGLSHSEDGQWRSWKWSEIDHADIIITNASRWTPPNIRLYFKTDWSGKSALSNDNDPVDLTGSLCMQDAAFDAREIVDLINSKCSKNRKN
jgi:hypothetical protein